ncbi:hypothetical protein [Paraflavitalea speifideaquila]|uniref:hypothetical protein n=1 Tax=Paraflavitalea speifideaquila TaxID=3076558 RepID=UPI0028EF9AD2|nr:hypothetical protein [Paraflavitalea speifideiaquila]
MNVAKIQLSEEESTLVQNAHWLLTKNRIIEKVGLLLGELVSPYRTILHELAVPLPLAVTGSVPKISKGEKYEGLPWVILDFPRVFGKNDTWAIRTLFWWGHFFSITLHLKGVYLQQYSTVLLENITLLQQHGFFICIARDEWHHHFKEDNYIPLCQLDATSIGNMLSGNDFCKLSVKIPLHQWGLANEKLVELYQVVLRALGH